MEWGRLDVPTCSNLLKHQVGLLTKHIGEQKTSNLPTHLPWNGATCMGWGRKVDIGRKEEKNGKGIQINFFDFFWFVCKTGFFLAPEHVPHIYNVVLILKKIGDPWTTHTSRSIPRSFLVPQGDAKRDSN